MRVLARMGLTLAMTSILIVGGLSTARAQAPDGVNVSTPMKNHKHHRTLLGKTKLCAECQRKKLLLERGVNVQPPPPLTFGVAASRPTCAECGRHTAVVAGPMTPAQIIASNSAGRGMVGGDAPGYASTDLGPAPIGVANARLAAAGATPPRDPAVAAASMPARDPVPPPGHNRPHVISHLLGVSALGRERADRRERKKEEKHASIAYGSANEPLVELPASAVYGRRGR